MTTAISPAEFMTAAPAPLNGSSAWASRYASEIRRVVVNQAVRAPRSLQLHLGPSELGAVCDRQVIGKMAGTPSTNHVVDPWPSVVGTAVHAWLADAFSADNERSGLRWVVETKVVPDDLHPGTADLYDAREMAVVDHKVLGETTHAKIRGSDGPPYRYIVQLLLYGWGYMRLGLPVKRVAIAAYPRTRSTLDGLYVWEMPWSSEADNIVRDVLSRTAVRRQLAEQVHAGTLSLAQIPKTPTDDECYFCPLYRPQAARDNGAGCPGALGPR